MLIPALLMLMQSTAPTMTPQMPTTALPIPRRKPAAASSPASPPPAATGLRLADCLRDASANPTAALAEAGEWAKTVRGATAAEPAHCRGEALASLDRWAEARTAFEMARDVSTAPENRARYGAMAGNAALIAGDPAGADALFAAAHADAAPQPPLAGRIAIDRARALVALKRDGDAAAALAEGRAAAPTSATGWLLSATLARRQGDLAKAQGWVQQAAAIDPQDPAIGLEAGVIAVLAGREDAARRSWQSVIATSPGTPEAASAARYLAQLAPQAPSSGK